MKDKRYQLTEIKYIRDFIFGGKAIFTIESAITGKWFTFKVQKPRDGNKSVFWVSVMSGKDNNTSYSYMGTIFNGRFKSTAKSRISEDAQCYKAFKCFYDLLVSSKLHPKINFYHSGKCACCGRRLTTPESVKTGIGPICINHY